VGLIVFGIAEIGLGLLCLLMVGLMMLAQTMAGRVNGAPTDTRTIVWVAVFYGGIAAVFLSLGIGSINCRRWARALTLILAWVWLGSGVLSVPILGMIMPRILAETTRQGPALPPGTLTLILVIQMVVMTILFIVIPGALVLFYSSRHVKGTCETRDPARRWTDALPLPVLGVVLGLWLAGGMMPLFAIIYRGVIPLFGTILSGAPGVVAAIGIGALWFWIGVMWYRRRTIGWWALLGSLLLLGISGVVTFSHHDITELYRKMGYPEAQINMISRYGIMSSNVILWSSVIWLAPIMTYLIWVKRFFRRSLTPTQAF
jgi:hypothetical protein